MSENAADMRQQSQQEVAMWGRNLELYKVSREQIQSYSNMRWLRLTTHLTSTGLLFGALAFVQEHLGRIMSVLVPLIGILYTLCFLVIEIRAGETLRGWVDESHRLEKALGGENLHAKQRRFPKQETSFRMMYVLFVFGWLAALLSMLLAHGERTTSLPVLVLQKLTGAWAGTLG